ncbi:MAG: LysM peptidoglycan-binding domain-containing protein, partial [Defluviitaleaceae bacterium]|nr:LysM peptidoglycan-binding domain-containing protein [Defluviitaleaceae bacterium]
MSEHRPPFSKKPPKQTERPRRNPPPPSSFGQHLNNKPQPLPQYQERERPPQTQRGGRKPQTQRERKPTGDYWMLFLVGLANIVFFFVAGFDKLRQNPDYRRYLLIIIGSFSIIIIAVSAYFLMRPNAFEIFLDEEHIASIPIDRRNNITAESLTEHIQAILENRHNTDINILDEITINSRRIFDTSEIVNNDLAVAAILNEINYQIFAAIITVNGAETVTVSSPEEAEGVLNSVADIFYQDGLNVHRHEFVENIDIIRRFVDSDEIITHETALTMLSTPTRLPDNYTIQSGDALLTIASRFGLSLAQLLALNPGYTEHTIIRAGDNLVITRPIPVISVTTFERVTFNEVIPMETEIINSTDLPR